MTVLRRRAVLAGAAATLGAPAIVNAQNLAQGSDWPKGPIKIIVPFPPGGSTDPVARIIQAKLTDNTGWQVVVDNKPGGASVVGANIAAKSPTTQTPRICSGCSAKAFRMISGPIPAGSPMVRAKGSDDAGAFMQAASSRVANVDESVGQAQLRRHMRGQSRCAIPLGGMVAAGQKRHARFLRQVRLRLGNFARDERICTSSDGSFKP